MRRKDLYEEVDIMKIQPPKQIMRYVTFKDGEAIPKEGMSEEYKGLFDEYAKEFKEAYILSYIPNDKDKQLAEIAHTIIRAYSGSYKPHLIKDISELTIKHTLKGYSLIKTEQEHLQKPRTYTAFTDGNIADFVQHTFLVLSYTDVKWKDIYCSKAVIKALERHFKLSETGITIELSNIGIATTYDIFGNPELPIHPTIWAKISDEKKKDSNICADLESKGFTHYKDNVWKITL